MAKQSISQRLDDWMRGRNGSDELGNTVLVFSLVLLLVNALARTRWLSILALLAALYACWRLSSTNIARRRNENEMFLGLLEPLARRIGRGGSVRRSNSTASRRPSSARSSQDFTILTCPDCGQRMRVPSGKGKMRVTCPACQQKFDTRS